MDALFLDLSRLRRWFLSGKHKASFLSSLFPHTHISSSTILISTTCKICAGSGPFLPLLPTLHGPSPAQTPCFQALSNYFPARSQSASSSDACVSNMLTLISDAGPLHFAVHSAGIISLQIFSGLIYYLIQVSAQMLPPWRHLPDYPI